MVQPIEGGKIIGVRQVFSLGGQEGYANGLEELNNICSIYGTGVGAKGARSVNIEDIDKITGYNPNNIGVRDQNKLESGIKYRQGRIDEYGNNVKYTLLSTGIKYEPINNVESGTEAKYTQFTYYDEESKQWKSLNENDSVTLRCNGYMYYPTTLTDKDSITQINGIEKTSEEYKMLFTNSATGADPDNGGDTKNFLYWIGSKSIYISNGVAGFGLRYVYQAVNGLNLYYSYGNIHTDYLRYSSSSIIR